jgi:hypothetical protein
VDVGLSSCLRTSSVASFILFRGPAVPHSRGLVAESSYLFCTSTSTV